MSMGFEALPQNFWDNSIFEKPEDRQVQCHGSSWDFSNGEDYRYTSHFLTTLTIVA